MSCVKNESLDSGCCCRWTRLLSHLVKRQRFYSQANSCRLIRSLISSLLGRRCCGVCSARGCLAASCSLILSPNARFDQDSDVIPEKVNWEHTPHQPRQRQSWKICTRSCGGQVSRRGGWLGWETSRTLCRFSVTRVQRWRYVTIFVRLA
ncbi:uncharacterized protein J3D65DRAFT_132951 [Phyllosticta citribraziliensis]|uniref:Uncharacterized protein n=1 Tax=Phyllosticta citribraziliensis TaxID=989973 RepID=A0ABR1L615_9PEZI